MIGRRTTKADRRTGSRGLFRTRAGGFTSWLPLRLPAHRVSSATLAGAYPFLAAPALDTGVYVGTDALTGEPFCFDPWTLYAAGILTNPNVVLAGVIGQGKSALAKSLAVRSIAAGRRVYVPGTPRANGPRSPEPWVASSSSSAPANPCV